ASGSGIPPAPGGDRGGDTLRAFDEATAAARALAALRPDDAQVKGLVSSALEAGASVRRDNGDLAAAAAGFEESTALARDVARLAPTHEARRNVAVALTSLGEIRRARGDLAGAQAAHEEALAAFRALRD